MPVKEKVTPNQAKVLRFIVTRGGVVDPADAIITQPWSDLPHTLMQSVKVMESLIKMGFATKSGSGYIASKKGITFINQNQHRWNK